MSSAGRRRPWLPPPWRWSCGIWWLSSCSTRVSSSLPRPSSRSRLCSSLRHPGGLARGRPLRLCTFVWLGLPLPSIFFRSNLPCIFARFWQRSTPLASTSTTATGGTDGNHLDHPLIAGLKSLPCLPGQPLARRRGQLSNHTVAHARHTPPRPWRQLEIQ